MGRQVIPITEAELRWAYRVSRLGAQGISYEQATANAVLRAALVLGVSVQRKRRARAAAATAAGAGIERSHPDFSNTHSSTP